MLTFHQNPACRPPITDLEKQNSRPRQINNWIVALKEDEENLSKPTKPARPAQRYQVGLERTTQFQNKLKGWLAHEGLLQQVAEIGKPTTFPLVMLKCTPEVAQRIRSLPEVDSVMADKLALNLIRSAPEHQDRPHAGMRTTSECQPNSRASSC